MCPAPKNGPMGDRFYHYPDAETKSTDPSFGIPRDIA